MLFKSSTEITRNNRIQMTDCVTFYVLKAAHQPLNESGKANILNDPHLQNTEPGFLQEPLFMRH